MALNKYKLAKEEHGKDHVFVLGNTKFLNQLNDAEAEILFKNGDARIALVKPSEVAPAAK